MDIVKCLRHTIDDLVAKDAYCGMWHLACYFQWRVNGGEETDVAWSHGRRIKSDRAAKILQRACKRLMGRR